MNYAEPRVIQVSMSNLKAWIESGLRSMKEIQNSQDVTSLTFAHKTTPKGRTVQDWEAEDIVEVQLTLKSALKKVPLFNGHAKKGVVNTQEDG